MKETELITNTDGSIFHLYLKPGELAEKIIIVGDPGRVEMIGKKLESIRTRRNNREFFTITGFYRGKEISVISSGIGTDNIDILINEIDALFNINLTSGQPLAERKSLSFVRLGTSGGLQADLQPGQAVISEKAIGFDAVMNYYSGIESISDLRFESEFIRHTSWSERLPYPYIINCSNELLKKFSDTGFIKGMTISTPGFYAPQGRTLFLTPHDKELNNKIMSFRYEGRRILNYEMESSAIYGLSALLGHKAITICAAIGNRVTGKFASNYKSVMSDLADRVLEII
ncbi:MAG: nucleoside phosphorylase [Bacteroidales bacterium]|nr:nucleoside phosphorylase [Bacteroidales bacterium]